MCRMRRVFDFPGNINVLVIGMGAYVQILEETQGIIAEFVNPKYADAERRYLKSRRGWRR